MTLDEVRQFAMSLPEVTEQPHFHFTSFRIGKIFATAPPGGEYLHVFVPDDERENAIAKWPDFLEELHWGKRIKYLRVLLPSAKGEAVRELLAQAWLSKAPKRLQGLVVRQDP